MMGKVKNILFKTGIIFFATIFAFLITGTIIANENSSVINQALGTSPFKKIETGENVDPETAEYFKSEYSNIKDLKAAGAAHTELVEAEGAVLLKNATVKGSLALPLAGTEKVSLFSITSVDPVYGGTGSTGAVPNKEKQSFKGAFENAGFKVNTDLYSWYDGLPTSYRRAANAANYQTGGVTLGRIGDAAWSKVVEDGATNKYDSAADVAFFILGRNGGEGSDMLMSGYNAGTEDATNGDYLKLSPREISVLKGMKALKDAGTFGKIVVLINSANQVELDYLNNAEYGIDACMWIGNTGSAGLYAVPKLLKGEYNPSGRLSDTFWLNHRANPVHTNFGDYSYTNTSSFTWTGNAISKKGQQTYWVYQEGIYLGYKYTETRYEDIVMKRDKAGTFNYNDVVAFPFGYGLSYSSFSYSNFKVDSSGNNYKVSVDVKNNGPYDGSEVVQIYLQKPYITNKVEKASVELIGFEKVRLTNGQTKTVTTQVEKKYFASYDTDGEGTYVLDEGTYYLTAGKDAHDAINNILAKKGKKIADGMTKDGNAGLVWERNMNKDATTFSTSERTGKKIKNLFAMGDINKYEGKGSNSVTYLSRANWAGTLKLVNDDYSNFEKLALTQKMYDDMQITRNSTQLKTDNIAYPKYNVDSGLQLIHMKQDADGNKIEYDDYQWQLFLDQLTWDETANLLAKGLRHTEGIERLGKPLTQDHNGPTGLAQAYSANTSGLAVRKNDADKDEKPTIYPCSGIIAATFNKTVTERIGELMGEDAIWAGYAGLYGYGNNIHRSPYEGRCFEYYSEDGWFTGVICGLQSRGIESRGCYVYNKHFVLNEQETNRMACGMWLTEQSLREIYLLAYSIPIEYGASCVMTTFTRLGPVIVGASKELMTDWLRGEAGMTGFAVTDMYNDNTVAQLATMPWYILAGNDLPDGNLDPEAQYGAFKTGYGELANAMRESAHRILYTVVHSNAMNSISTTTILKKIMTSWQIALMVSIIAAGVLALGFVCLQTLSYMKRDRK